MTDHEQFDEFVRAHQRALWQAVVPIAGPDAAADAVADALVHAWTEWSRVAAMDNPVGYLYVIARRRALLLAKVTGEVLPDPVLEPVATAAGAAMPDHEPGLVPALGRLSEMQRQVVYLVEGFGWGLTDAARILDISVSTVRNHLARGMDRLRAELQTEDDDD